MVKNKKSQFLKFVSICSHAIVVLSLVSFVVERNNTQEARAFHPGAVWNDTDGIPINAHGGGIVRYRDAWYWFGEHKTEGRGGNSARVGVSCYSSKNLYDWKNEGIALRVETDSTSEIVKGCVIERPKVIYNKSTQKFVMWFHLEYKGQGYRAARAAVAWSDRVTGPYTFIKSWRINAGCWPVEFTDKMKSKQDEQDLTWWTPAWREAVESGMFVRRDFTSGQMSRDMTLFVDTDDRAYLVYASEENLTLHIAELSPDYLAFTGRWTRVFPGGHNEAPTLVKYDSLYVLITSGCTGWDPNAARSAVSSSIWGPWTALENPCKGPGAETTFESQGTFILPVQNGKGGYIFMADRWNPKNPIDGRYVWLPVSIKEGRPSLEWYDVWDLNCFK